MPITRTYRVPGGMVGAWIVTILPFAYALVAVVFILVPGTVPGKVGRLTYELTQFIPLILIVLLTTVFYIMGHRETSNQDVIVDLHNREAGIGEVSGGAGD